MALTTIPAAGDQLRAAVLSSLITEVRALEAHKTADETVNNSATFQNDNELVVPVAANSIYLVELDAVQSSGTAPDFKFTFTLPSGATGYLNVFAHAESNVVTSLVGLPTATFALAGVGANARFMARGYIITSTTAGNAQLQWAQNGAAVSDTIVRQGGTLVLRKIS